MMNRQKGLGKTKSVEFNLAQSKNLKEALLTKPNSNQRRTLLVQPEQISMLAKSKNASMVAPQKNRKVSGIFSGGSPLSNQKISKQNTWMTSIKSMQTSNKSMQSNKEEKEIDFHHMFTDYRKRTEFNMPHTAQQTEDVIFTSQNRLIALEYIFYSSQNENKYYNLVQPHEKMSNSRKDTIKKKLDEEIQTQFTCSKWDNSVGFVQEPKVYEKSNQPEQPYKKEENILLGKKSDYCRVEAFISIWKINEKGHLVKQMQKAFDLGQKFRSTQQGQMQLFLSLDKSIVTLGLIDDEDQQAHLDQIGQLNIGPNNDNFVQSKKFLTIKSWQAKDLKEVKVTKSLKESLANSLIGTLNEINYIGENNYLMLTQTCEYGSEQVKQKLYTIFDRMSGEKLLEIGNHNANQHIGMSQTKDFQLVGMLARDKNVDLDELGQKRYEDVTPNRQKESDSHFHPSPMSEVSQVKKAFKGTSEVFDDAKIAQQQLSLIIFFVGTLRQHSGPGKTALTFEEVDLIQLIKKTKIKKQRTKRSEQLKSSSKHQYDEIINEYQFEEIIDQIMEKGLQKFKNFHSLQHEFFEVPSHWFVNKQNNMPKQWHTDIDIGTTKFFDNFGILNRKEELFLAFTMNECESHRDHCHDHFFSNSNEIGRYHIPQNSVCNIIRNQSTKRFLMICVRTRVGGGGGCQAICFYHKTQRQTISFQNDHIHAFQDVQTQAYSFQQQVNKKRSDKRKSSFSSLSRQMSVTVDKHELSKLKNRFLLQSCSISEFNQEIFLNTETAKVKGNEQEFENVFRKSISQRLSANYPLLAYNLGLDKVLIQNTQGEQNAFIFKLPKEQQFVDFVQYNDFKDLDFNIHNFKLCLSEIQVEMCSSFVFLTKHKNLLLINILMINPYSPEFKVAHFLSNKCFEQQKDSDQTIQSFIYSTDKSKTETRASIKLITQYSSSFTQRDFKQREEVLQRHNEDLFGEDSNESYDFFDEENNQGAGRKKDSDKHAVYKLEPIPMILTQGRYMYYVTCIEKFFIVNQIDLRQDNLVNHKAVFEKRLRKIKSFGRIESKNCFYFIDEHKNITILKQNEDTMILAETGQLYIKDHEKPAFNIRPFETLIVDHMYIIQESRIFYLTDEPVPKSKINEVILNMEHLSNIEDLNDDHHNECKNCKYTYQKNHHSHSRRATRYSIQEQRNQTKSFTFGPVRFRGSEQFLIIFEQPTRDFLARVYQLPDSSKVSMINHNIQIQQDQQFSTFFISENQKMILIKQENCYSVFDDKGVFVSMVQFKYMDQQLEYQKTFNEQKIGCQPCQEQVRMKLLKISNNIKYFLFIDSLLKQLVVYELCVQESNKLLNQVANHVAEKRLTLAGFLPTQKKTNAKFRKMIDQQYEFRPLYSIDIEETDFFNKSTDESSETENSFSQDSQGVTDRDTANGVMRFGQQVKRNIVRAKITDNGNVIFMHHETENGQQIEVEALIFKMKDKGKNPDNFMQRVEFPGNQSLDDFENQIKLEEEMITEQIKAEEVRQRLLPKHFQDNSQIEQLEQKQKDIEQKSNSIIQYNIFGNLMLVQCGYQIKYGYLPLSKDSSHENMGNGTNASKFDQIDFLECRNDSELLKATLNCQFVSTIQIVNMMETQIENVIQIIARDNINNILIIMSWDFSQNIEYSMYQVKMSPEQQPENHIVRGLNGPLNYIIQDYFVYDLQNNIPFQQSSRQYHKEQEHIWNINREFIETIKLYSDPSRYLCIEFSNILLFPVNRIDILFWMGIINNHKENINMIRTNFHLNHFSKVYENSQSLFHYFSTNLPVIEMFHKKFLDARESNQLQESEEEIPLIIMLPNKNFQTAMDIAIQKLRPRCFELMIDMLSHYKQNMLTKMMLNCIPDMIVKNTIFVKKFLDSCVYKSLWMELAQVIPWPQQMDQKIFPCHTSIISQSILEDQIFQHMSKSQLLEFNNKEDVEKQQQFNYSKLRDFRKFAPANSLVKRINIEAIDLDWVFIDDNAQNLIMLLQNHGNGAIYNSKVLRIFIDLVWERFQPQLIKRVFIPFIIYLYCFVTLASLYAGIFMDELLKLQSPEEHQKGLKKLIDEHQMHLLQISCIVYIGVIYFARFEYKQMQLKGVKSYFQDGWNFFDAAFLITCTFYLIALNYYVISEKFDFQWVFKLRLIGGVACFLMWVKMFYWMRIFSGTAHFVTLIGKTLSDIKVFCLMLGIILFAFSNFFFTINNNTYHNDTYAENKEYKELYGEDEYYYLNTVYYNCYINSIINVYLLMLGEFYYEDFKNGPNDNFAWIGFVLATFIVLVVFMNLLIAIMGESFQVVKDQTQESLLTEQLGLIQDHIWLVDLKEEFKGKKYIIRISPDETGYSGDQNLVEEFHHLSNNIITKNHSMHENIKQSNNMTELRMREMMKQQQIKTSKSNKYVQNQSASAQKIIAAMQSEVMDRLDEQDNKLKKYVNSLERHQKAMSEEQENQINQYKKIVLLQDKQIKELIAMQNNN